MINKNIFIFNDRHPNLRLLLDSDLLRAANSNQLINKPFTMVFELRITSELNTHVWIRLKQTNSKFLTMYSIFISQNFI